MPPQLPQMPQQQGMPPNMQQQQQQQQRPPQGMQRLPMSQAQYQQAMAQQMAHQRQQAQQSGVNGAQTDGASDMEEGFVLTSVNAQGEVEMGRVEIDNLIREHIEAKGRAMEGGGLMLPLKEHFPAGRSKKRKAAVHKSLNNTLGQTDGGDDDDDENKSGILKDEEDEDAINSDLDDPEDDLKDDDEDEDLSHIMLCMYDKVQRVKNKW